MSGTVVGIDYPRTSEKEISFSLVPSFEAEKALKAKPPTLYCVLHGQDLRLDSGRRGRCSPQHTM